MSLRERVQLPIHQQVQELELAAKRRHDEAVTLLLSRHAAGAVYLLGYVAEMRLKEAAYRRLGARPNDQARVYFRRARDHAQRLGLSGHLDQFESGHGLLFWARLVWSVPTSAGESLQTEMRYNLFRHVRRIEQCWTVEMRYSADPGSSDEAESVLRSVEWITRNRVALWS